MSDAFGIAGAGEDLASSLRARVYNLLYGVTLAGGQVEECRDSALTEDEPFHVGIFAPKISREEKGNAPPQYDATVTLLITGKATGRRLKDAVLLTDTLRVQIEMATLGSAAFWLSPLQTVKSIETNTNFSGGDARHEGFLSMLMECVCTDFFYPQPGTPLREIVITVPNPTIAKPDETLPAKNLIGSDTDLT